jgi:hypothetical protein
MVRTRGLLSTKPRAIRVVCNVQDLRIGVRRSRVVLVPLQLSISLFSVPFITRLRGGTETVLRSSEILPHMSTTQQNMSTPPRESTLDINSNTTPLDAAQATLSSPGQASPSVVENPPEPSAPTTVLGAMQAAPPRRASSSSYHISLISKPVPEIPQEHIEVIEPAEVPPRVASPMFLPPASVSTHGGHGNKGVRPRADTPPRRAVRVAPSYPILDETIHAPHPVIVPPGGFYPSRRRSTGRYPDSETAWHVRDEPEPVRLIASCPRSKAVPGLTGSVWVPSVPRKKCWPALDSDRQRCNRRVC